MVLNGNTFGFIGRYLVLMNLYHILDFPASVNWLISVWVTLRYLDFRKAGFFSIVGNGLEK